MAATWAPIPGCSRSVTSTQAKTEAAPTASTDGQDLTSIAALTFWLDAGEGQTITADAGQVDIYLRDGEWGLSPGNKIQIPTGSAGQRRVQLATVLIDNPRGRLAVIANGIMASGATVTLEQRATLNSYLGPVPG
jgi:hypothetical protein